MFKKITLITLLTFPLLSTATVTFDDWTTEAGTTSGNYIVTVEELPTDGTVNFHLTVDPWNAEALGVFFDFGDFTVAGGAVISASSSAPTSVSPAVALYDTDTSSNSCGAACNLNGLSPTLLDPDGEWELVFRLANSGYEGIQSFWWTVTGLTGFDETSVGLVGVRAQVLCSGDDLLPDNQGSCGGSDKSFGDGGGGSGSGNPVPEPSSIALIGLGLVAFSFFQRKHPVTSFKA